MGLLQIRLVQTCGACPEQYDAFIGDKLVGYLRLRHGYFTVSYPDSAGRVVYEASTRGDGLFADDEREHHLEAAKRAISRAITREQLDGDEAAQIGKLREIADENGWVFRESYSGRNMGGAECVGIVGDDAIDIIEAAAALGIRGARQDNMGRQYIVYWPALKQGH